MPRSMADQRSGNSPSILSPVAAIKLTIVVEWHVWHGSKKPAPSRARRRSPVTVVFRSYSLDVGTMRRSRRSERRRVAMSPRILAILTR